MNTFAVMLCGRKLKQFLDAKQAAIREQYGINRLELEAILYFSENPGAAAIDLHRELGLNKGQISKALERLQRESYMEMKTDAGDRRLNHCTLLEKGKAVSEVLRRQREAITLQMMRNVTEEEKGLLDRILGKIFANIEDMVK